MPEITHADLSSLPAPLLGAIRNAPLPPLDDQPLRGGQAAASGTSAADLIAYLQNDAATLVSDQPNDPDAASACRAALWLLAGDLDRSHQISQSLETPDGSFWHGVMHRREGDFSNACYWFRRTGAHPAYAKLTAALAGDSGQRHSWDGRGDWDPVAFVDQCEQAVSQPAEAQQPCIHTQWIEWQIMFEDCVARLVR